MNGLLVDTMNHTFLDVKLSTEVSFSTTDKVELLSAEDSIIELGASARETPTEVLQWDPAATATNDHSLRLVAKTASDAWFELVAPDVSSSNAIPLALQVDLGNGSWESSLIPTKPEAGESDNVTFDLVLAWAN